MPVPYSPKRRDKNSLFGGLASELPERGRASEPPPPPIEPPKPEEAVVLDISNSKFLPDLQKHLDDYEKGKAYLSFKTNSKLKVEHLENGESLAPNDLLLYESYRTGLQYEAKAYMTHSVNEAKNAVKRIADQLEEE